jgi:phosphoribosylanthranilate isomerase
MIIKVCGLRESENINAVSELGVDIIGLIFYPKSPRYVSMVPAQSGLVPDYSEERLDAAKASRQFSQSTNKPLRTGVFVDDMPQNIITRVYNFNIDIVQLHGNESPVMIENLRKTIVPDIRKDIKFIKTISISSVADIELYKQYEGIVDMFIFDTKCVSVGGGGNKFDWNILDAYDGDTPFLLSGGISPEDVERVKSFSHPRFAGIDLNSRFETSPGIKDIGKLKTFIDAIKK